ncbi:MAG: PA14 domain-containing protein [Chloroflexota bacterium]
MEVNNPNRTDHYQVRFLGCIGLSAGTYTFHVTSDDGAYLFINNQLVVSNSGKVGWSPQWTPHQGSGSITVSADYHPFELKYNQFDWNKTLEIKYERPGIDGIQPVPDSALGCQTGPAPTPIPTATQPISPLPTPTQPISPLAPPVSAVNAAPGQASTLYLPVGSMYPNGQRIFTELVPRDTDGDGVSDVDEIMKTGTSPFHSDTDILIANPAYTVRGTSDADEDPDGDGISNINEIQIANGYSTDPLLADTDGDGLSDSKEVAGFLDAAGNVVYTDPDEWDTDGDGLSDGDEIGSLVSSDSGIHYEVFTDPNQADADFDGLNDLEELGIGTNPNHEDTDRDLLVDGVEADIDFDPLDPNPDGDHRRDDVEYLKGSDPYYPNPTALVAARWAVQGALFGDWGENLANDGWISEDVFVSLPYMSGWIASGFFGVGDIRDTAASLARLDAVDTLLNALAFAAAVGDALKIGKVIEKVVSFAKAKGKNLLPIMRWVMKNFEGLPGMDLLLGYFEYSDEAIAQFCKATTVASANASNGLPLLEPCASSILERLGKARNRPNIVNEVVAKGGGFIQRTLSLADWTNIKNRANDVALWGGKAGSAEARAVETTEVINTGNYDILYTGRQGPLYTTTNADGTIKEHFLLIGPDMVAVNRTTGETVVIEIKGKSDDHISNSSTFRTPLTVSPGDVQRFFQPQRTWLDTNPNRYLDPLENAVLATGNQLWEDALARLDGVTSGDPYEAIVFGFVDGQFNEATFGKLDRLWDRLNTDALRVDTYLFDRYGSLD